MSSEKDEPDIDILATRIRLCKVVLEKTKISLRKLSLIRGSALNNMLSDEEFYASCKKSHMNYILIR